MSTATTNTATMQAQAQAQDEQQRPTVAMSHVRDWFEDDVAAVIESKGLAHICTALHGAQTLAAVMMQAAVSRDDAGGRLKLCGSVEQGLIAALSACLEVVESHALNTGNYWTTSTTGEDERQTIANAVQSIAAARFRKTAGRGAA